MAKLTLIENVLRREGNTLILAKENDEPCCCVEDVTIEICNSNAITDDDWRIELNGQVIGTHSAPGMILAGTVWREKDAIQVGCGEVTYYPLDTSSFVVGQNTLYMEITKLYECGGGPYNGYGCANLGTVKVTKWRFDAASNSYVVDTALLDTTYTGPSQIGYSLTFTFNYQ